MKQRLHEYLVVKQKIEVNGLIKFHTILRMNVDVNGTHRISFADAPIGRLNPREIVLETMSEQSKEFLEVVAS